MCPMCVSTAVWLVVGATSADGLAVLAVKSLLPAPKRAAGDGPSEGERDGNAQNRDAR